LILSGMSGGLPKVDHEILTQALEVDALAHRRPVLVTFDTAMAFEGRQVDLEVVKLGDENCSEDWRRQFGASRRAQRRAKAGAQEGVREES
jgi:hypothetical protein